MNRSYAIRFVLGMASGILALCAIGAAADFYSAPKPAPQRAWTPAQLPTGEPLACYPRGAGMVCVPMTGQED